MDKYELANKIFQKALEVDRTTKHNVFVYFHGNAKSFEVDAFKNGWRSNATPNYSTTVWLDDELLSIDNLKEILDYLNELEGNK